MAVQEQTPLQEYTANGIAKQFDLEFDCESADHLIVSIDDLEVLHTDWYLSGNAIMFHIAPANGKRVKIQRNTPFNRLADYQSYNNSFRPPAINKDFDRIWWKLQELGVADWILSNRISALKAYVDDRDDELRAYLMEEIRKQGVALDQLDEYYNYLMERLAQIAVDKGWDASFVVDASGKTQQEINNKIKSDWVFVEDFGAKPSPFDSTSAFNAALAASRHVMTRGGVTYNINGTLNFDNEGTSLFLASGARIVSSLTNTTLFSLNATNCKIYSFGGEVESPEQRIGTQGTPTFGVVRLNANDCVVDGVRFKNYYRFCIQINNTTRHTIKRNSFDGNVPYSFYIENNSNTLSRGAISYDNPPASTELNPFLNISDNHFMNDVQGIMSGNFGLAGNPYGVRVVNNSFYNMYDHAMYLDGVSADYAVISNNTMIECRRPIVAGGNGTVITGNTFKGITQTRFFEQYISLRDPINCIVSNNTFDGWGAGIALQGIINTTIKGNIISNNVFNQTGVSSFNSVVRIYATDVVDDNSVIGNTIKGFPAKLFGSVFIDATTVGKGNKVKNNTIHCYSDSYVLYLKNQIGGDFSGNELLFSYDSDVAITVAMLSLLNIKNSTIKNNAFRCVDKGANVTLRGVNSEATSSWNSVEGNTFELTAPSLVAKFPLFNFSASNNLRSNVLDVSSAMMGSFQLGTTNTIVVTNTNVTTASTIIIQPKTSAAATLMATQGFYVTQAAGSFTFIVGGAAPTAATDWNYVIV